MGIKLLNNIKNVSKLNANLNVTKSENKNTEKIILNFMKTGSKLYYLPSTCKYQSFDPFCLVQIMLQNALIKHNVHSNKKSIIICVLTILSTVDLFRGAEVWFIMSFVSWPV